MVFLPTILNSNLEGVAMKLLMTMFLFLFIFLHPGSPCICEVGQSPEKTETGVIVVAHGAPVKIWTDKVLNIVEKVNSPFPLETAFLDYHKEKTLANAINRLEDRGAMNILVVHLSPSSYSVHHEEIKYLLNLREDLGIYTEEADPPIKSNIKKFVVSPAMDHHPLVADILTDYTRALSRNPENESLILLGHGPVEELANIVWVRQLEHMGKMIRAQLRFREIVCMTMRNDSADLIREQAIIDLRRTVKRLKKEGRVIVVPYLLGKGGFHKDLQSHLKGMISPEDICMKGVISHLNTARWIEDIINRGLDQPYLAPINRNWSTYDYETGKPVGTHRYGFM
jgi:hypothetical protein